jgi:hypothetical protein
MFHMSLQVNKLVINSSSLFPKAFRSAPALNRACAGALARGRGGRSEGISDDGRDVREEKIYTEN